MSATLVMAKPPLVIRKTSALVESSAPLPPDRKSERNDRKHDEKTPISELEETILKENDGKLDVLPLNNIQTTEFLEHQAVLMAAVEGLMYKGIRSPHLISQALTGSGKPTSNEQAAKLIKAVIAQWATKGSEVDIKAQRGEALAYLDYLQQNLWTEHAQYQARLTKERNSPAPNLGVMRHLETQIGSYMKQITELNNQRNQLYGLTPQVIQNLLVMGGAEDHSVLHRIKATEEHKNTLGKLAEIIERKRRERAMALGHPHTLEAEVVEE